MIEVPHTTEAKMQISYNFNSILPNGYTLRYYHPYTVMCFNVKRLGMPNYDGVIDYLKGRNIDIEEYYDEHEISQMLWDIWQLSALNVALNVLDKPDIPKIQAFGRNGGWWGWYEVPISSLDWDEEKDEPIAFKPEYKEWYEQVPVRVRKMAAEWDNEYYAVNLVETILNDYSVMKNRFLSLERLSDSINQNMNNILTYKPGEQEV